MRDEEDDHPDDGPGFCYAAIPKLAISRSGCGPLNVALDTNIIIDLLQHGNAILAEELDDDTDPEVVALAQLLDVWMMRAIRFHLSYLNIRDAKKELSQERMNERLNALHGLAAAITCHNGEDLDWTVRSEQKPGQLALDFAADMLRSRLDVLPAGYDRRLIAEALVQRRHVFLTRDKRLVNSAAPLADLGLLVCLPSRLIELLIEYDVGLLWGGTIEHEDCPLVLGMFGDTHKWGHLWEAFDMGQ